MEIEYLTIQGDRWDTISYKCYGDPFRISEIAAANPSVPLLPVLPGGLVLRVPVINDAVINVNLLPPWKR